jgi:RNA polymerase sigma factor (sigma-70 family)
VLTQIPGSLVSRLYRDAHADRWHVPVDDFARALERSAAKALGASASAGEVEKYLRSLRLEELALACACASGHEAAWEHFVLKYRPILYRSADALDPGGGARDLADSLYADLFGLQEAAAGERRSLFRYFHGRSSLATWLRAVLSQRVVDRARAAKRTTSLPDDESAEPLRAEPVRAQGSVFASELDPERRRYVALIHAAFAAALAGLDPRERLRLLYYYAHGLTLAETGRLTHEHEASVSRHLSAARKKIRRDVEQHLGAEGLDAAEIARCFEYVSEDSGLLDLDRMLNAAPAARNSAAAVLLTETSRTDRAAVALSAGAERSERSERLELSEPSEPPERFKKVIR